MNKELEPDEIMDPIKIKKEIKFRLFAAIIFLFFGIWYISFLIRYPIQNVLHILIRIIWGVGIFILALLFFIAWHKGKKEL